MACGPLEKHELVVDNLMQSISSNSTTRYTSTQKKMSINKWQHHLVNTLKLSLSGRRRRSSPANLLPRCFSTTTVPIDPSSSSNAHSFVKLSDELFIHCHEGKLEDAEDILFNKLLETKFSGMCAQQILLEYRKIVFRKDVPRQTQTQAIQSAQRLIAKTEKHLDSSSRGMIKLLRVFVVLLPINFFIRH